MRIVSIKKSEISSGDFDVICQKIAQLESQVLPQDAWQVRAITEVLGQFGAGLIVSLEDNEQDLSINWQKVVIKGYCIYQSVFETSDLHRIGTHPDFVRQGVANRLLDELIGQIKMVKSTQLLLEVRADNLPAKALYQKLGFEVIDVRKGYYTDCRLECDRLNNPLFKDQKKTDALIMRLAIAN